MKSRLNAFTLLETIVALAIFSIAVVGSVKALDMIGGLVGDLRMEAQARRSLENHAMELRAQNAAINQQANIAASGISISDREESLLDDEAGITSSAGLVKIRMTASWKSSRGPTTLSNTIFIRRKS